MKLCACITEKTAEECVKAVKGIDADLIEHRIDFLEKVDDLEDIYSSIKIPVIATIRSVSCGGKFEGSEDGRVEILMDAIEAGASFVDIEIDMEDSLKKNVIAKAREKGCKVIISMHDFEKTPGTKELIEIMKKEKKEGADIGKIVTTANSIKDCQQILNLLLEAKKENFSLVAFTMGDLGKFTRIICLEYGAPFSYASIKEEAAPGQINIRDMKGLIDGFSRLKNIKKIVVIGHPIKHSLSPVMQNRALKEVGLYGDYIYEKVDVKPENFIECIDMIKKGEIYAANITMH